MAAKHLLFLLPLFIITSFAITEQQILLQTKKEFGDPPSLESWNVSAPYCSWAGIECTNGSVSVIVLSKQGIKQPIPATVCDLKNLIHLNLSFNHLPGPFPTRLYNCTNLRLLDISRNLLVGPIPSTINSLSKQLRYLSLSNNYFTGDIPPSICQLSALQTLLLNDNHFNGAFPAELSNLSNLETLSLANNSFEPARIPHEFGNMTKLVTLRLTATYLYGEIPQSLEKLSNLVHLYLANNSLSGRVPAGIWTLQKLQILYLYDNKLSGDFPQDWGNQSSMRFLDVGNNNFSGEVPASISLIRYLMYLNLKNNRFVGNIPRAIGSLSALTYVHLECNQFSGPVPAEIGNLRLLFLNLSFNKLSGEIPIVLQDQKHYQSFLSNPDLCQNSNSLLNVTQCDYNANSSGKLSSPLLMLLCGVLGTILLIVSALAVSIAMRRQRRRKHGGDCPSTWKQIAFQADHMQFNGTNIEQNLTNEKLIGNGGGGMVYRIALNEESGKLAAVKKIWNSRKLDARLENEFLAEVQILGQIRHANIVRLLGCSWSSNSKLLIYEYMENGSLDHWLHHRAEPAGSGRRTALDWLTRLRIAVGAAKGLCYLHHDCSPPIVHRDIKSGNILLDSEFQPKIADFGLARILIKAGEPETVSAIAGSFGYMAPECGWSRKVNEKMDVYSFGVVLLELITGRKANDGGDEGNLADWVWHHFDETGRVGDFIGDEIKESSYVEEMVTVLKLGIICTGTLPSDRPSIKDVLQVLLRITRTRSDKT